MDATTRIEPFALQAPDGRRLGAVLYEPTAPARGTLLLHGATATPQRFYRSFGTFLAEAGVRVVTYDYRGVGESRSGTLRGDDATMTDWARQDARAAHRHVKEHFGAQPIALLGHSFGGQLVGLIDEAREVAGALFVGAQFGYYGFWPVLQRPRLAIIWHAVVPALNATLGYVPGRLGIGEDLPAGVAGEWARWCTHPDYLISEHPDAAERFARFDPPTAFYSFTDDAFASRRCVDALLDRLPTAALDHRRVDPRDLGKGPIGHFGFFRAKVREPLWTDALEFLTEVFEGRPPTRKGRPVEARRDASGAGSKRSKRSNEKAANGEGGSGPAASWDLREEDVLADLKVIVPPSVTRPATGTA